MAKSNTVQIKLVSTADTGFFYVTKKNARAQTTKLELNSPIPLCGSTSSSRKPRSNSHPLRSTLIGTLPGVSSPSL